MYFYLTFHNTLEIDLQLIFHYFIMVFTLEIDLCWSSLQTPLKLTVEMHVLLL